MKAERRGDGESRARAGRARVLVDPVGKDAYRGEFRELDEKQTAEGNQ